MAARIAPARVRAGPEGSGAGRGEGWCGVKLTAYAGRAGCGGVIVTRPDGSRLDPGASLAVRSHSPTGFAWGYHGSGRAQLALALILDTTGAEQTALALYQRLKEAMVSRWPMAEVWTLPLPQLRAWIEADWKRRPHAK